MKEVGFYLILTFVFYLLGQVYWTYIMMCDEPLFGSEYLQDLVLCQVYTASGVCGLISGIKLYKLNK